MNHPASDKAHIGLGTLIWRWHFATPARASISLLSLLALLRSYWFVYQHFSSPAWFDFWRWVADYQLWVQGRFGFHDLIKPHNEHRIVTTRLLLLFDSVFFHMDGRSVVIVNLVVLAVVGILLWRLVRLDGVADTKWDLPPAFWVALICGICQVENLIYPFQVQFALACVFSVASLYLLLRATECARPIRFAAAAGICAVLAMFSMASGVLLTPALAILLILRKAGRAVWAMSAGVVLCGLGLFFDHYDRAHHSLVPIFDLHATMLRTEYAATFLASALNGFPGLALGAGLLGLVGFAILGGQSLAQSSVLRGAVPGGDSALIAIAAFVVLCGVSGSLTPRIVFGVQAALVTRYATMSLLFAAALLGLCLRRAARQKNPARLAGIVQFACVALILWTVDLPYYDIIGRGLRHAIAQDASLLVNNVGIAGSVPVVQGTVDDVRREILFLQKSRLNMFSPGYGMTKERLARLRAVDAARLPSCRGWVDESYSIDGDAILLVGWVADPRSRLSPDWIGVTDEQGHLLGTAPVLEERRDVRAALGSAERVYGFNAGLRLNAATDAALPRSVRILGVFAGNAEPICALPGMVSIGPVLIEPVERLQDGRPAGTRAAGLTFDLSHDAGSGRAVALPFRAALGSAGRLVTFVLRDGSRIAAPLPAPWCRQIVWRAAVLQAAVADRHGGVTAVEVQPGDAATLTVGMPEFVTITPGWSRLF